jgi:type IX secretion system PorP/SprF family membrane protein
MKANKKILLKLICFITPAIGFAQDIHFSQMTQTPLLLNPAMTSLTHKIQAIVNYKDQWRSVGKTTSYKTMNVSADFALMKKKTGNHIGLGVNFFSDKAGDGAMATTTGQLHLSGVLLAGSNSSISAGIYGGFGQRSLAYDKLYWDNQYDGMIYNAALSSGEPVTFSNHTYADLGVGLAWFYSDNHSTLSSNDQKTFTVGLSAQHLNKPIYSFYGSSADRLPIRFIQHATADIGVKNWSIILEPSYIVMMQTGHREVTAGMLVKYILNEASKYTGRKKAADVALGAYYRYNDAIALVTRYEFSNYSIGLSYDVNVSNFRTASKTKGGLEISLRFISPGQFDKATTKFFN